jgi:hypothetical protein
VNRRTLSSALTFLMKFVFPIVWISGFGLGTLALWAGAFNDSAGNGAPPEMKWAFLAAWTAGTAFILWGCAGLKKVRMDQDSLYISNFRKEIVVPLSSIGSVTENRWINIHPITIHFRAPTEFGNKVTFMPTSRFFGFWSSHPVVEELRGTASGR